MERFNDGAARMGFPAVDGEVFTELIKQLVSVDEHWIPTDPGCSMYIRPTMIGTKAGLGVTASTSALLYVM
jgi:branched-chain amino acid aminotransferase